MREDATYVTSSLIGWNHSHMTCDNIQKTHPRLHVIQYPWWQLVTPDDTWQHPSMPAPLPSHMVTSVTKSQVATNITRCQTRCSSPRLHCQVKVMNPMSRSYQLSHDTPCWATWKAWENMTDQDMYGLPYPDHKHSKGLHHKTTVLIISSE